MIFRFMSVLIGLAFCCIEGVAAELHEGMELRTLSRAQPTRGSLISTGGA